MFDLTTCYHCAEDIIHSEVTICLLARIVNASYLYLI